MRNVLLLVSIVAIILFSGCVDLQQPKSLPQEITLRGKEIFREMVLKQENCPASKSVYSQETFVGGRGWSAPATSTYQTFRLGSKEVTCGENSVMGKLACAKGAPTNFVPSNKSIVQFADKVGLFLTSEKVYAGRPCYNFSIRFDSNTSREIYEYEVSAYGGGPNWFTTALNGINYEICLDKEYGFVSFADSLNTKSFSGPLTLVGFTPNDLSLPIDFGLVNRYPNSDLYCEEKNIDFTLMAFNDIDGDIAIKITEENAFQKAPFELEERIGLGQLKFGDEKDVNVNLSENLPVGSYSIDICNKGSCIERDCFRSHEEICEDSDGGKKLGVKGTVKSAVNTSERIGEYTDYCISPKYLKEYYCVKLDHFDIYELFDKTFVCENGCEDGACIDEPVCTDSSCTDSDNSSSGVFGDGAIEIPSDEPSFYTLGTIYYDCEPDQDYCAGDYLQGRHLYEEYLYEWGCSPEGKPVRVRYSCPNGCYDGACIK